MARPIDADDLLDHLKKVYVRNKEYSVADGLAMAYEMVQAQPTVEVEPVKRGRWKEYDDDYYSDTYECTSCGGLFCMIEGTPTENGYDYCPNCGAKMDEVEE